MKIKKLVPAFFSDFFFFTFVYIIRLTVIQTTVYAACSITWYLE